MSKGDDSHTEILLPGARVALFTRDGDTKASFLSLAEDWRFARVALEAHDGDTDTAIAAYQGTGTPDLVIVQTDNINESFLGKLETLSASCSEGTAAIVIGPVNDVNLYRKLVGMGVSDYLVRPVKKEQLGNDIAASLIEKIGATGSRLIALIGSRGGVGVTSLAEALAWGLSDGLGQKTFLLDAAAGWSSLSVGLDFEPSTTLAEAVRAAVEGNEDSFSRMMFHASDKLTVLSSGSDVLLDDTVSPEGFETMIDHLMVTYPIMIADLSAAPAALKRTVLARAHEIILVTTPTLPAVRSARTLLQEIKQLRGGNEGTTEIVVNMQGLAPKDEVPKAQIEAGLDRKSLAFIPFDPATFLRAEGKGEKLGDDKNGAAIVGRLVQLTRKILASAGSDLSAAAAAAAAVQDDGKKSGIGGFLDKLKKKS